MAVGILRLEGGSDAARGWLDFTSYFVGDGERKTFCLSCRKREYRCPSRRRVMGDGIQETYL